MDRRLKLSVLQTPTRNKNKTHEFPKHSNKIFRAGRQCSARCSSSLSFSYEESIKWLISCYFFVLEEHPQFWKVIHSEGFRSSGLNASNFTDDDKVESKFYWSEPGKSCNYNAISWLLVPQKKPGERTKPNVEKNRRLPVVSIQSRLETSRSFCVISLLEFVLRRLCIQTTGF